MPSGTATAQCSELKHRSGVLLCSNDRFLRICFAPSCVLDGAAVFISLPNRTLLHAGSTANYTRYFRVAVLIRLSGLEYG